MLAALLLLEAAAQTAIDAERAFYRAAQTEGQWKAFRAFSTPDAVIFTPQPAKAHEVLPNKEPPIAVQWWPAASYVSCDGKVAVNTGPWVRPKASGYFTTVWVKQPDGAWRWVMDGGDALAKPRPLLEKPSVHRASCEPIGSLDNRLAVSEEGSHSAFGESPDHTLKWYWNVKSSGARFFQAELWDGRSWRVVLSNDIAAAP